MTKRRIAREPRRFWTPHEDAELTRLYATEPAAVIAERLGRSLSGVYQRVGTLGLSKPPEVVAAMARERSARLDHGGRDTRFKPGRVSWNKGTRFVADWRKQRPASLCVREPRGALT